MRSSSGYLVVSRVWDDEAQTDLSTHTPKEIYNAVNSGSIAVFIDGYLDGDFTGNISYLNYVGDTSCRFVKMDGGEFIQHTIDNDRNITTKSLFSMG